MTTGANANIFPRARTGARYELKSAIYHGSDGLGIGGAENTIAILAQVLERYGSVTAISGKPDLKHENFQRHFGIELNNTEFVLRPFDKSWIKKDLPWSRITERRNEDRSISEGFDILIAVGHLFPPFCAARLGIVHSLFPIESPEFSVKPTPPGASIRRRIGDAYNRTYFQYEIVKRLKSYSLLTTNSDYTRRWTERRWGRAGSWTVWHPPVTLIPLEDSSTIRDAELLGVGRFDYGGGKMHPEMVGWFRDLPGSRDEIRLTLAGSCSQRKEDRQYLENVTTSAADLNVRLLVNISLGELQDAYRRTRVFWHAMGYGVDESTPELCEHFGMTTVEAMSAGCVPVVVDRGGQAEIVEHGVSGFRWQTPGELLQYTHLLLNDDELWNKMSLAARERAKQFSRERFEQRLIAAIENLQQS